MANVPADPAPASVEKSGFKTSEFWVMLLTILGSLGVGVYSTGQTAPAGTDGVSSWAEQLVHKLTPVVSMVVSLLVSFGYTSRRTELKRTIASMVLGEPAPPQPALTTTRLPATVPVSDPAPTPVPTPVPAPGPIAPSVVLPSGTFQAADGSVIRIEHGQIVQIGGAPGR